MIYEDVDVIKQTRLLAKTSKRMLKVLQND